MMAGQASILAAFWVCSGPAPEPASAQEWLSQGVARAAEGNLEAALDPFRHACELEPKHPDACYFLGRNLFALSRYDLAVQPLETALRAARRDARWRVHRSMARNFEVLGRPGDAERHFRECIRLQGGRAPSGVDPRVDYGAFLFRQGRAAEALAPLEQAAAAGAARAHAELGRVLLDLGRVEAAAASLERAVEANPRDWAAHLLLGKAYYRLGRSGDGERQTRLGHQGLAGQAQGSPAAQGSSTAR
jgi:tetratricopeptide (TPR) repeat protein